MNQIAEGCSLHSFEIDVLFSEPFVQYWKTAVLIGRRVVLGIRV
ncbi:hypothetical protein sync_0587 [Synechococcus sp. CC9311]|nr:hypothetical protein sync_0587 [Synechococcus sp. CC9311]